MTTPTNDPFDVLYVTSFTPEMYALTGMLMVKSFLQSGSDGRLLVCHEGGMSHKAPPSSDRLIAANLDHSPFLQTWLAENHDIIPDSLGGTATRCRCEQPDDPWGPHREGCCFQWFNKNASRWFRKIVALDIALQHVNDVSAGAIVWVDCDCRFMKRLPSDALAELFDGASVLYHCGRDRPVIESGVIAFKLDADGRRLLETVIERFRSGEFRQDVRWDDGFQFHVVVRAMPDVMSRDLAGHASSESGVGHVLPGSPLGEYIRHLKGVHSTLKLMV